MAVRLHQQDAKERRIYMGVIRFMKSAPGRIIKVAIGFWLIAFGGQQASMWGLVLMMVGVVPAVTGIAGICLIEEFVTSRLSGRTEAHQPREHHA